MLDSFNSKRSELSLCVQGLQTIAARIGAPSVADSIRSKLLAKLEEDRFHLVVVGEFNHGKTTFVNALLGQAILPVGITPTTAVIHQLEYAASSRAAVQYESGECREISIDDLRLFAVGNPAPSPDPGPVDCLRVWLPSALLSERIRLIDTPGVNDLSLQRADITYSYVPRADAVLFLLDAGQLLKESERVFLQDKLLAQSRDKIIFVVTKKDILEGSEREEALSYVRDNLARIVDSPRVFAVSAEQHLRGDTASSGMNELLEHLTRFLSEERGRILLDNVVGEALSACGLLDKGLDAKRRGLCLSADEVERRIQFIEADLAGQSKTIEQRRAMIREEIAAIKAWSHRDLERFVSDVSAQIPGIVDQSKASDLKVHLGPFLEKAFKDWAQAETKEVSDALEALAEKTIALVREDAREAGKRLADAIGGDLKSPEIRVDSFAYDIGVAALATLGLGVVFANWMVGGLLMLAAPVLAFYMRDRIDEETRARAKEMAPQALRNAADSVGPKFDEMIDAVARRLDEWVVGAGEEVHREVLDVLRAAQFERRQGAKSLEHGLASCDEQGAALQELGLKLSDFRAALWAAAPAHP